MEYVVIGAGPAGQRAGHFLQRARREYVVLEAGPTPGTFYRTFPRHRRMISINKPHTGLRDQEKAMRYDWNSLLSDDGPRFTTYTGKYFPDAGDLIEHAAIIHVAGPRAINFAWRTHFIGHLRAVNSNFLDTYQLKSQNMVLDGDITGIRREGSAYVVTFSYARRDRVVELAYDRVIACTGFKLDSSIFDAGCMPALTINDRFPEYTSAFVHGFRYGVRALVHMLEERHHGVPWPHRVMAPDSMPDAVLERINRTAALFQQYGFMCDVLTPDGRYYEEMPLDYVPFAHCVTVSLEYGRGHDSIDPFDLAAGREWEDDKSRDDRYLHPVVRSRRDGEVVATLSLPEDIYNDWTDERLYREPLQRFLKESL